MWVGGPPHTDPKKLHAPYTKANREAILLLSAKNMIGKTRLDILTSCPTNDESACPIYDESDQVFEDT